MTISALILAGGRGRRLGNVEKALISCGNGSSLIEHAINVLENIVGEVIISVRDEAQAKELETMARGNPVVLDSYDGVGPLAGILEGFNIAKGDYIFVTACDMPFIDPDVVKLMFDQAKGHDAALPVHGDGSMEPLCGVYRVAPMLPLIKNSIRSNRKFILAPVFDLDDVIGVDLDHIRSIDPQLRCFVNINTAEDLKQLDSC